MPQHPTSTPNPNGGYAPYQRTRLHPIHQFQSLLTKLNAAAQRPEALPLRKEVMGYVVTQRSKTPFLTKRDGTPLTDKEGNPQQSIGVMLEGMGDNWFNIYLANPSPLASFQIGDVLEGAIQNKTFLLNGVSSGGQPPAAQTTPQPTNGSQAPPVIPQTASEDKMRSKEQCMRGEAVQAAAAITLGPNESPDDLFSMAQRIYDWIVTGSVTGDGSNPPF